MTVIRTAWHFIGSNWRTSTGGLLVEIGKPLIHVGDLMPCISGLHASTRAIDAVKYASGPVITLVKCEGEFIDDADKFVCRKRTALWGYDATDELWVFARKAALEVLHLWPDAPDFVREYLETGDDRLREVTHAAGYAAAQDARTADVARGAALTANAAGPRVVWAAARSAAWPNPRSATPSRLNEILESILFDGAVSRGLVRT